MTMAQDIAQQVAEESSSSSDLEFLERLKAVVEQHVGDEDFSVQSLSEMMAMDRTVLYRRMQALTGMPPSVYVKSVWIGLDVFNLLDISNVSSYYWVTDVNNIQYAVPNYLTRRQLNVRLSMTF